ncbi:MAG: 4-hydroxy-tetrahydrodipicolinate synthase [Alphaproteobacteria bacterium]|nr:4-hydroxy-tetrahydrodipicolinate synthase [Alphaproteobacteria bacterium]
MFKGSYTALITPIRGDFVDESAFVKFVNWQIEEGTHGLVPVGTTGESPTLSHEEHVHVVGLCVREARGRIPVIAGTGSNSTAEAIRLGQQVKDAGADALLIVCPYYNKPSQEGLYQHFKAINDAVDLPQFIYNIPGRSAVDMSVETMARLFELRNIFGVKDATADLSRIGLQNQAMGSNFIQFSGEDSTALGFNIHGGLGCISVTANIAPAACAQFQNACLDGDWLLARTIHDRLMPLHHALFIEPNPAPVKYAASLLGLCTPETRLPIVPVSDSVRVEIRKVMVKAKLLSK